MQTLTTFMTKDLRNNQQLDQWIQINWNITLQYSISLAGSSIKNHLETVKETYKSSNNQNLFILYCFKNFRYYQTSVIRKSWSWISSFISNQLIKLRDTFKYMDGISKINVRNLELSKKIVLLRKDFFISLISLEINKYWLFYQNKT